ncbi:MAG: type II toxin-antitoxin system RelE/ParE family toxin [Chloroflexota bacterium]
MLPGGDYRIIYEIIRKEKVVIIHSIGHRREIYQKKK